VTMSSSLDSLLKQLEDAVNAGNVEKGQSLLNQVKIAMLSENADAQKSCRALEYGVLLSVASGDLEAFGRNVMQLQPLYRLLESPRKAHILGLNLMALLVENRLSEFHSQLELLTEQQASDPLISFPISLERQLMVGMYDKVLEQEIPDKSYQFFMDQLLQTVRDSIADCMEVAYNSLTLKDAAQMMKFQSKDQLLDYIQKERDDWIVENKSLLFQPTTTTTYTEDDISKMEWIQQSLTYATELERIV